MDGRTYYIILGVPRTETPVRIRSAYRDLAKKMHPDVAGEQATHAFQEITEAYDVLSDPQRRRAYNDELRRAEVATSCRYGTRRRRGERVRPFRSSARPTPFAPRSNSRA